MPFIAIDDFKVMFRRTDPIPFCTKFFYRILISTHPFPFSLKIIYQVRTACLRQIPCLLLIIGVAVGYRMTLTFQLRAVASGFISPIAAVVSGD